jgi:hypothetical protein
MAGDVKKLEGKVTIVTGEEGKPPSGQHFYSRTLLQERVNNGVDLYQGDEAFLALYTGRNRPRALQ